MDTEYILDIRDPDNNNRRLPVSEEPIIIGSDNSASLIYRDEHLSPLHLKIRLQDEVLTLTQLGQDDSTKLGRQKLKQGKMYIADKGDKITLGSVKIIIRKEKKVQKDDIEKTAEIPDKKINSHIEDKNTDMMTDHKQDEGENTKQDLSKIIRKAAEKRNNAKTNLIKKKSVSFENHLLPGFFSRVTSHMLSFLLVISALTYGLDYLGLYQDFNLQFNEELPKLSPILQKLQIKIVEFTAKSPLPIPIKIPGPEQFDISSLLQHGFVIQIVISYLLFQTISILLLGVEFPLFLMGVRSEGNPIFSRVKGIFRLLIGIITFPLIIFDLPIIFKKRSLKEVITFTKLQYKKSGMQYFGVLVIFPVLTLILLALPFSFFLDTLQPPTIITKQITKPKKEEGPVGQFKSNFLEMIIPIEENMEPLIFGNLKIKKNDSAVEMGILDNTNKSYVLLSKRNFFNFQDIIPTLKNFDPLFSLHSPVTSASSNTNLAAVQEEILEIVEDILGFDIYQIHNFIMNRGIFFYPYLKVRSEILEKTKIPLGEEFLSYTHGNKTIFVNRNSNLIVLKNNGMLQLELIDRGEKSKLSRYILNDYLLQAKKFDLPKLNTSGPVNGFEFFDLLWEIVESNKEPDFPFYQKQILLYLLEQSKKSIENDLDFYKGFLVKTMINLDKYFLGLPKNKQTNYENMRLTINRIQKAFDDKDMKFLNLNIKNTKKNLMKNISKYNLEQSKLENEKKIDSDRQIKEKNTKQENSAIPDINSDDKPDGKDKKNARRRKRKRKNQ